MSNQWLRMLCHDCRQLVCGRTSSSSLIAVIFESLVMGSCQYPLALALHTCAVLQVTLLTPIVAALAKCTSAQQYHSPLHVYSDVCSGCFYSLCWHMQQPHGQTLMGSRCSTCFYSVRVTLHANKPPCFSNTCSGCSCIHSQAFLV